MIDFVRNQKRFTQIAFDIDRIRLIDFVSNLQMCNRKMVLPPILVATSNKIIAKLLRNYGYKQKKMLGVLMN